MGTDRKGPLAAFVVIAVVAAILLVTSVRSQARPQWFDHDPVSTTVVAAPPIGDPLRWAPVTTLDQVVEDGVVLTPKATSDPTSAPLPSVTLVAAATYDGSVPATTTSGTQGTHTVTVTQHHAVHHTVHAAHHRSHHLRHHPVQDSAPHPASSTTVVHTTQAAPSSSSAQHGRHLGWTHASAASVGHDHGRHAGRRHH